MFKRRDGGNDIDLFVFLINLIFLAFELVCEMSLRYSFFKNDYVFILLPIAYIFSLVAILIYWITDKNYKFKYFILYILSTWALSFLEMAFKYNKFILVWVGVSATFVIVRSFIYVHFRDKSYLNYN